MIDLTKVNDTFRQTGNSCVLASYAIAFNYFTGLPCEYCFEAYCQHFGLSYSDWKDAEQKYNDHFHIEYESRKGLGYEIITELHDTSLVTEFVKARETFNCELIGETQSNLVRISGILAVEEALINITSRNEDGWSHSVTAFCADGCFYVKNTNHDTIDNEVSLLKIPNLADSLLLRAN